jgi:hypothetical protein
MPYHVGAKGSYGCSGYPALKNGTNEVMGCHTTRAQAAAQIYAINRSEGNIGKAMVKEGDMVMAPYEDNQVHVGRVVHVMTDGMLGFPGSEYSIVASAEDPAILIQLFEMEDGGLDETEYFVGHKSSEVMPMPSLESNVGMDKSFGGTPEEDAAIAEAGKEMADEELGKEYKGCGCPTCKQLNVDCPDCPVCSPESMDTASQDSELMDKAKGKPNYGEMIKPRSGGSTPANPRLYAAVVQAAKDKFDVYPSAVANGWVVQEYKRRGGTYKGVDVEKKDYSMDTRRRMAESGQAMKDGSFPIADKGDLMDAIRSVGRASNYAAAKAHIISRARALNAMDMLPEDWRNKANKGMGEWSGSIFDLNPFVK